jgi:hypothetical protein
LDGTGGELPVCCRRSGQIIRAANNQVKGVNLFGL